MSKTKKLISIVLVAVLAVSMVTVAVVSSKAVATDGITVYYYDSLGATTTTTLGMFAYSGDEYILGQWGNKNQTMQKVTDVSELPDGEIVGKWYKYVINDNTIVVKDSNGTPKKYLSCNVMFYLSNSGKQEPLNGEDGYVAKGVTYIKNGVVNYLHEYIFEDNVFKYSIIDDEAIITDYSGSKSNLEIPAQIEGRPVVKIANRVFYNCESLNSVIIPSTVKAIGDFAFYSCPNLQSAIIPEGVTSIGEDAFGGCNQLSNVSIPSTVTSLGEGAFWGTKIAYVNIPDGITSIGISMFGGCVDLKTVTIPESVTSIGNSAFSGCFAITDVYYGGSPASWRQIEFGSYSEPLKNATIHYAKIDAPAEPSTTMPTEPQTTVPTESDVTYIIGDADMDGLVNIKDATAIQKYIAGIETGYPIGQTVK